MAAGLDLHILVILGADLTQLESGAHLTVQLILLLAEETNETAMSSQARKTLRSHFLTSEERQFSFEKCRRFLSLHPVTQQKPILSMSACTKTATRRLISNMKQIITLGSQVISLIYNIRAEGQDETLMTVNLF